MSNEIDQNINKDKNPTIKKIHYLGLVSFILSIIGLFVSFLFPFALQIIGIILGHVSKSDIDANPEIYQSSTLVSFGLII